MKVLGQDIADDRAALYVCLHLLHEGNDLPERVVDIVRDAPREMRERVLPLDLEHAGLEVFERLRPLERHGRERHEVLDDGEFMRAEGSLRAAGQLQDAERAIASAY